MLLHNRQMLISLLKVRGYVPYRYLSDVAIGQLEDAVRILELEPGDVLSLAEKPGWRCLSVLTGTAKVITSDGEAVLTEQVTQGRPHKFCPGVSGQSIMAETNCIVCLADSDLLDHLVSWDEIRHCEDKQIQDRLKRVHHSIAFKRLPLESVQLAFQSMRLENFQSGVEIVRQGEHGDAFYLITKGRAEVWQTGLYDDEPQKVAELSDGDAFGEEALVTGGTRNASVKAVGSCECLVLDKESYANLVARPLIDEVDAPLAQSMIANGYELVDVRYQEEFEDSHIPGAKLTPLQDLRSRIGELDPSLRYVVYCRSGKRSAVAALLLRQRNISAVSLKGGLIAWPYGVQALAI